MKMKNANPNYSFLKKKVPDNRVTLLQGGTRSGKTYSIIYYLIYLCNKHKNANLEIDICRDTYTALKSTTWKDFKDILISHNLYNSENHNKTDHVYNLYGNNINYYGADTPAKIHGRSRDILWVSECQQFLSDTINQLFPRTRYRVIGDYNPALPVEHWLDKYINQYPPLITTYKDNPHLTKEQIEDIESKVKNEYWWKVYGRGIRSQPTGAIFSNWKTGEFIETDLMGFGQDYGFSNDPSVLCKISIDKRNKTIYLKEMFYEVGLNTGQIYELNLRYAGKELVVGDSAEPRLISELRSRGGINGGGLNIVPSEKGQGSVNAGLSLMNEYDIIIHPDSKNLIKEFTNYSWIDKTNKSVPMDAYNHCIDACRYLIYKLVSNPHRSKYYIS